MGYYIFLNRYGERCEKEADPSRPETWPFAKEEIKDVYLNCTKLFLTSSSPLQDLKNNRPEFDKLRELLDYISVRYKEKLTFDFALSVMGMSKSRFCVFFKNQTGMSYIAYINKVKVEQAALLLNETDLKTESIGYDCGFDSPPSFFKCFKKHYGVSPARFRVER